MSADRISTVEDEAADWLVRRDAGLSPADEHDLGRWIAVSPQHERAWTQAAAAWASFDAAHDDLLETMRGQALSARPAANDNWRRALIAASVAGAVLLAGVQGWRTLGAMSALTAARQGAAVQTISTARGQRSVRRLADGSRVTLDSQTTLQIDFGERGRRLRLVSGQAYFEVAADPRAFSVAAGDRTVTDIGTRFAVRRDKTGPGAVTVILDQGLISITGAGEERKLQPGDRFRATQGAPGVVDHVDAAAALAWRDGYLEFHDTPLKDAAEEINRYGGRPIMAGDGRVANLRISGRFRSDDPAGFAEAVAALQPVDAVASGAGISLRPRR